MATGSGKTLVMAMLIAWQVLNKVAYPQDTRYAKNIFIVAPGLTVKSRLQVLIPAGQTTTTSTSTSCRRRCGSSFARAR